MQRFELFSTGVSRAIKSIRRTTSLFVFSYVTSVVTLSLRFLVPQVPIDGDLLTDGDGLSAAEQVAAPYHLPPPTGAGK